MSRRPTFSERFAETDSRFSKVKFLVVEKNVPDVGPEAASSTGKFLRGIVMLPVNHEIRPTVRHERTRGASPPDSGSSAIRRGTFRSSVVNRRAFFRGGRTSVTRVGEVGRALAKVGARAGLARGRCQGRPLLVRQQMALQKIRRRRPVAAQRTGKRLILTSVQQSVQNKLHATDAAEAALHARAVTATNIHLIRQQEPVEALFPRQLDRKPTGFLRLLRILAARFKVETEDAEPRVLRVHVIRYRTPAIQTVVTELASVLLVGAVLFRMVDRVRYVRRHKVTLDAVVPSLVPLLYHLHLVSSYRDDAGRTDDLPLSTKLSTIRN